MLIVIAALGAGALFGGRSLTSKFGTTPDFAGAGTGEALIVVKPGDTATDIAATMVAQGVVKSEKAFANAAKDDARALGIQPGTYKLRKQMSGAAALQLILDPTARRAGPGDDPRGPERRGHAEADLARRRKLKLADLQAAAKDTKALEPAVVREGQAGGLPLPGDLRPGAGHHRRRPGQEHGRRVQGEGRRQPGCPQQAAAST